MSRSTPPADPRDLLPLPRALALGLWTAAYLRGDCGPDDAVDGARGTGHRHVEHTGLDLYDWMTGVRRLPLLSLRPVLPVPGRLAGLVGPPAAVTSALDEGQALVVTAGGIADMTVVASTETIGSAGAEGQVVRWAAHPAPPGAPMPPPLGSGTRELLLGDLRRAAASTVDLDLVPEEPIPLAHLPAGWTAVATPPGLDGPHRHLMLLAARTLLLARAELAAHDGPGQASTPHLAALSARTQILRSLEDAAREALVDVTGEASQT